MTDPVDAQACTDLTITYPAKDTDEPPQTGDLMFLFVPPDAPDWVAPTGWTRNRNMATRWYSPSAGLPVVATVTFARPIDVAVVFQVVRPVGMAR